MHYYAPDRIELCLDTVPLVLHSYLEKIRKISDEKKNHFLTSANSYTNTHSDNTLRLTQWLLVQPLKAARKKHSDTSLRYLDIGTEHFFFEY
jgi:hypothetical protein